MRGRGYGQGLTIVLVVTPLTGSITSAEAAVKAHYFRAMEDLNGRAGKSLSSKTVKVNQYGKGQSVGVVCQDFGGTAYGSQDLGPHHQGQLGRRRLRQDRP